MASSATSAKKSRAGKRVRQSEGDSDVSNGRPLGKPGFSGAQKQMAKALIFIVSNSRGTCNKYIHGIVIVAGYMR